MANRQQKTRASEVGRSSGDTGKVCPKSEAGSGQGVGARGVGRGDDSHWEGRDVTLARTLYH